MARLLLFYSKFVKCKIRKRNNGENCKSWNFLLFPSSFFFKEFIAIFHTQNIIRWGKITRKLSNFTQLFEFNLNKYNNFHPLQYYAILNFMATAVKKTKKIFLCIPRRGFNGLWKTARSKNFINSLSMQQFVVMHYTCKHVACYECIR